MKKRPFILLLIALAFCIQICAKNSVKYHYSKNYNSETKANYLYFLDFFRSKNPLVINSTLRHIESNWDESFEILTLETIYFIENPDVSYRLLQILTQKTGKNYKYDFNKWYEYIWNKPSAYNNNYFRFKAEIHQLIDIKFYTYFANRETQSTIRLDEVRWGGVVQDGIPPLRNPKMIEAHEASYLDDSNIVFGIEVNGEVRAYPKRILAWHEMFTDTVGEKEVAGVYCTLCGTVILYLTEHKGVKHKLGTSGFLYRSNKMMYDKATQSLWSTALGKPILGPLINKEIQLDFLSVVTTTWGAWKLRHPNTKVLSLHTGYRRNYDEGIAYQNYFATDKLMFNVPSINKKLKNKDEVLVIRTPKKTLAISSLFLKKQPLFVNRIGNKSFMVLTDKTGGHRTFYNQDIQFKSYNREKLLISEDGDTWLVLENSVINTKTKQKLPRLHTYNAFWFGFQAVFPKAQLIK